MQNNKKFGSFAGKGYYIALILCAVAIGITGYLYYRNLHDDTLSGNPDATIHGGSSGGDVQAGASEPGSNSGNQGAVDVINPTQDDVPAVATDPSELPGGIHDSFSPRGEAIMSRIGTYPFSCTAGRFRQRLLP